MAWWPWRKKSNKHVSDLGLRPLMDEFQNLRRRFRKTQRQTRTVVVVRKDITNLVNIVISIVMLSVGFWLGIWYGRNGGGGNSAQTIQKKVAAPAQKVVKQTPPETPPEKSPLVPPVRVESRTVVIAPTRADIPSTVLQKSPVPEKPPEPMSPAKRLLLQLENKLPKE